MTISVLGLGDATVVTPEAALPEPLRDTAISCRLLAVPDAVFPGSTEARLICEQAYFDAGMAAAADGSEALYINTVGDYGVIKLQTALDIPVCGAGAGALRQALQHAERFSILTLWPPGMRFIYDMMMSESGLSDFCSEILHLSSDNILASESGPAEAMKTFQACGVTTIEQVVRSFTALSNRHPGDAIVLGCTCMYPLARILKSRGLEVVEPMFAGYRRLSDSILSA